MKQQITDWLTGGAGVWILSAALRAMPAPKENASILYVWAYNFAGILGANFDKFASRNSQQQDTGK